MRAGGSEQSLGQPGYALCCAAVETLLETSNHVGWGGRGLVAGAWRPALPLRRCLQCLTRDYLTAAAGVSAYGHYAPQHDG